MAGKSRVCSRRPLLCLLAVPEPRQSPIRTLEPRQIVAQHPLRARHLPVGHPRKEPLLGPDRQVFLWGTSPECGAEPAAATGGVGARPGTPLARVLVLPPPPVLAPPAPGAASLRV